MLTFRCVLTKLFLLSVVVAVWSAPTPGLGPRLGPDPSDFPEVPTNINSRQTNAYHDTGATHSTIGSPINPSPSSPSMPGSLETRRQTRGSRWVDNGLPGPPPTCALPKLPSEANVPHHTGSPPGQSVQWAVTQAPPTHPTKAAAAPCGPSGSPFPAVKPFSRFSTPSLDEDFPLPPKSNGNMQYQKAPEGTAQGKPQSYWRFESLRSSIGDCLSGLGKPKS